MGPDKRYRAAGDDDLGLKNRAPANTFKPAGCIRRINSAEDLYQLDSQRKIKAANSADKLALFNARDGFLDAPASGLKSNSDSRIEDKERPGNMNKFAKHKQDHQTSVKPPSKIESQVDKYKLKDIADEDPTDNNQRILRDNEKSVFHQPPEVHKQLLALNKQIKNNNFDKTKAENWRQVFDRIFNKKSDIYQLGCTMFEMITYGVVPFNVKGEDILTNDARKVIESKLFMFPLNGINRKYTLELASWNQMTLHEVIGRCTNYEPFKRPSIKQIEEYYMANVLAENGISIAEAQCKCGKGVKPSSNRKFFYFF